MTLGSHRPQNSSASNSKWIPKEVTDQDPSRALEHSRFNVRHIINRRKLKEQDARTYLNSERVGKEVQEESYYSPLRQEEYVKEDPYFAPVIFKTPLSARILSVPNQNKVKLPVVKPFDGSDDPTKHIASYRAHMAVSTTYEAMLCKFFPTTLSGLALN